MSEGIKKFEFEIEGRNLLMHNFNGQDEEKRIKELPDREQAEKHAYRGDDGLLYIPCNYLMGSLINAFVSRAGNKEKTKTKMEVASRIMVEPMELSLGISEYKMYKRSVPFGNMSRGGGREMVITPRIENWKAKGILVTTLDREEKDLKTMFTIAGMDVGIGGDRVHGFGRFTVTSFKKL